MYLAISYSYGSLSESNSHYTESNYLNNLLDWLLPKEADSLLRKPDEFGRHEANNSYGKAIKGPIISAASTRKDDQYRVRYYSHVRHFFEVEPTMVGLLRSVYSTIRVFGGPRVIKDHHLHENQC